MRVPPRTRELEYFDGLVRVKGTLHIKVTRDQNKVSGVYWMDVDNVEQDTVNIPWLPILGVMVGLPLVLLGHSPHRHLTSPLPAACGLADLSHGYFAVVGRH